MSRTRVEIRSDGTVLYLLKTRENYRILIRNANAHARSRKINVKRGFGREKNKKIII